MYMYVYIWDKNKSTHLCYYGVYTIYIHTLLCTSITHLCIYTCNNEWYSESDFKFEN